MGYSFVPFPDDPQVRREVRPNARLDRLWPNTVSGTLEVEFECLQPVHIGSGFKAIDSARVIRETSRAGNQLVIPGSSLKGVLRARYEAITRSCTGVAPNTEQHRVVSRSHPEVKDARLTDDAQRMESFARRCGRDGKCCPACALFGYQNAKLTQTSRVRVSDLKAPEQVQAGLAYMPDQYAPRLHHLGKPKIETGRDGRPIFIVGPLSGRKFYSDTDAIEGSSNRPNVEVIPQQTRLTGIIQFRNLDAAELGGLLFSLGHTPKSHLKIGSGKTHRLGKIALVRLEPKLIDAKRKPVSFDSEACQKAFERSADYWAGGAKRLIEIHS